VPYKCPDVALRAFASRSELANHRMIIVGDGPERPKLEQIVRDEKLEGPRHADGKEAAGGVCPGTCGSGRVVVFPSIRELGAGVVVEAMACGMTCVVVDYGGPGALIRDGNGVKVPLASKDELVRTIGEQLVKLAVDPGQCVTMGEKARNDALGIYGWDVKARKTVQAYEWALGRAQSPTSTASSPPQTLTPRPA
jgi:glycosyltransferase involved in cell wall biosynthesis